MITNVRELRQDGQYIEEGMTSDDIHSKLGGISRTVGVEWNTNGKIIKFQNSNGLWVKILPNRDAIVLKEADDPSGQYTHLRVLNEDGIDRFAVSTIQTINDSDKMGTFAWFEEPRSKRESCFAVVFVVLKDSTMYQLDIDGETGQVIGIYPMQ
jgi:hypothetical protein